MSKEPEIIFRVAIALFIVSGRSAATEVIYASVTESLPSQGSNPAHQEGRLEKYDLSGTSLGGFRIPPVSAIALDRDGNVAVSPAFGSVALKYNADGKGLGAYDPVVGGLVGASAFGADGSLYLSVDISSHGTIQRFANDGTWMGVFRETDAVTTEMTFDNSGNLIFAGTNGLFSKIDPNGMALDTSNFPANLAVTDFAFDSQNNLYVVRILYDTNVLVFSPLGTLINTISVGSLGMVASTVAIDKNDVLYVGGYEDIFRSSHGQIRRFLKDGTSLGILVDLPSVGTGKFIYDMSIIDVVPEPANCTHCIVAVFGLFMSRRRRLQK